MNSLCLEGNIDTDLDKSNKMHAVQRLYELY